MTALPRIAIAHSQLGSVVPPLRAHYTVLPLWEAPDPAALAETRILVAAGELPLPDAVFEAMPRLGLIAVFSVGYDGIDVAAMRRRGLEVSHARDANHEDVADHAIGLILAHRRKIVAGEALLRAGLWGTGPKLLTRALGGARLGLVGLGAIGGAIARRAEAMRMTVGWWGPRAKPDAPWPRADSLTALARASDIMVLTARATEDNRAMIDAGVLDALGPEGLLVNVSRGQLIDEPALIAALRDGRLGGAALDVYTVEPTPADMWADVPNTLLTPHSAGATDQALAEMQRQLRANIDAFLAGRPVLSPAA
ncbi:2-hydroxyacid dehydrogenase [Sphingomonas morindae]|uniref:2-hydroxyacid dehydrogenase n=1 Tax=Sphingomonas morindae TaxID=1541170 RepID=A0ABY4XA21_9SPHN|nr:2-hydroxyacid dehydrogenase [Sphingomonas morindae]USI73795.1 2-hydroxyacid dehydrogenase [Sphingomonas morindae]